MTNDIGVMGIQVDDEVEDEDQLALYDTIISLSQEVKVLRQVAIAYGISSFYFSLGLQYGAQETQEAEDKTYNCFTYAERLRIAADELRPESVTKALEKYTGFEGDLH